MTDWITRILIVLVLAVVVGLPLLLRPSGAATAPVSGSADRLVIVSPHNEQIRFEMAAGFNRWRSEQRLPTVEFDWRSSDGTSGLRRQVLAEFQKAAEDGREDDGVGYDLFFGGGDIEHNILAGGITVERGGRKTPIDITLPPVLPAGFLETVFPEPEIGGLRLYHPKLQWIGAALSSFGIVYNRDVLAPLRLPEPETWTDLQSPAYRGMIAVGDPSHSGSVGATYNVVLRRLGWTDGWAMLRRVFANARYFTDSASKPPVDVSAGEAAAGMCIDFYGRLQAGAVGGHRVGYVDPRYMTAINADPISILRGAPTQRAAAERGETPEKGLANQFVIWLLSPQAQDLWQKKLGTRGGPVKYELRRLPIRRDLYSSQHTQYWTDPEVRPFTIARPFLPGMPDFYLAVAPVTQVMAIDVHDDLVAAWQAIAACAPEDPRRARMVQLFDTMPPELTLTWPDAELAGSWRTILEDSTHPRHAEATAALNTFIKRLADLTGGWRDPDRLLAYRLSWTRFFQRQYRQVAAMAP